MMTEREKIIEIVLNTEITGIKIRNITGGISTANAIADALIEAGYGDKSRHRLFISKDGTVCKQLYSCEEVEQIAKERDEYKHRAEVAERQAVILSQWLAEKTKKDYPWQAWLDAAQKQSEKELAEEGKDG